MRAGKLVAIKGVAGLTADRIESGDSASFPFDPGTTKYLDVPRTGEQVLVVTWSMKKLYR